MDKKYIKLLFSAITFLFITISLPGVVVTWQSGSEFTNHPVDDIVTTGALVDGRNYGASANVTVNGVTFSGFDNGEFGNTYSGFLQQTHPDADYHTLLDTAAFIPAGSSVDVNFGGLTIGQDYLVQLWYIDTRSFIPFRTSTIISDQGGPDEASGNFSRSQFIVGTFTADAASVVFNLSVDGGLGSQLNAAQLRAVPETETYALIFGGLSLGLVLMIRRRRSKSLK